jgi:hypothetical protein
MRSVSKAIGALLGGLTGGVITAALGAFDVAVTPELAAAIALILATAGTWIAPPNQQTTP